MFEVIGIERIDRQDLRTRRIVKGITLHCIDHTIDLKEGVAVKRFYFPDPSERKNRAANIKLGDVITEIYYNQDKFPVSYDLKEEIE